MSDAVVLDGDRHESALAEKRGQFQEVCGCGWRSSWTTDEAAGKEHADHVAAEKMWGRLTEPQRAAFDSLMTTHGVGSGDPGCGELATSRGPTGVGWSVNGATASKLADLGMAVVRPHGQIRLVQLTARGMALHPLSRCSARHGGDPCGYCHACRRRLPVPDLGACPHCSATDWDDD